MNTLTILKQMRKDLDKKEREKRDTIRIQAYLNAIENDETEKYWDYRDALKGKMSFHDYMVKYHGMKDKRDTRKERLNATQSIR
jgi:hypothetical protein